MSPRPISNFSSIGAVDSSAPQVDIPGLLSGLPPVATDLATALKEFEPSFLERNASALEAQRIAADNAAHFGVIAKAYASFGEDYTNTLVSNIPAPPGFAIRDAKNPLGLDLSSTPPLLLNKFGLLNTRPPVGPQLVPSDGVIRESAAVGYLRSSGAFAGNAGTIEAQVGPVIQPFVLNALGPVGQAGLYAQGGYQMGQGYGQYQNGDTTAGTLSMAGGALTAAGSLATTSSFAPRVNSTTIRLNETGNAVQDLLYGARAGEGLPGSAGTQIAARPSPVDLANLTEKHGVEFAVTYKYGSGPNGAGGQYYLFSGEKSAVDIPLQADSMLIYHTHPLGTPWASEADRNLMKYLQDIGSPQRTSRIVPVGKDVIKFTKDRSQF